MSRQLLLVLFVATTSLTSLTNTSDAGLFDRARSRRAQTQTRMQTRRDANGTVWEMQPVHRENRPAQPRDDWNRPLPTFGPPAQRYRQQLQQAQQQRWNSRGQLVPPTNPIQGGAFGRYNPTLQIQPIQPGTSMSPGTRSWINNGGLPSFDSY